MWSPNNELSPRDVLPLSNKIVNWICEAGHELPASIDSRVLGTGCGSCVNLVILPGSNDFVTMRPDVASQWCSDNDVDPSMIGPSADIEACWVCPKGHHWPSSVRLRTKVQRSGGSVCSVCSNRIVVKGVNDLQTTHPMIAKDWHPGNPKGCDEVTAGTVEAFAWICEHDHAMHVPVARRVRAGGCSDCVDFKQSRVELEIWSHLEDLGHDVSIGVPIGTKWRGKIDAALVEGRIAIEYDGSYWHSREGSAERDLFKTRAMLDAGWTVIRLRAGGLGTLDLRHEAYFELDCAEGYGVDIRAIAEELSRLIDEKRKQPLNQRLLLV